MRSSLAAAVSLLVVSAVAAPTSAAIVTVHVFDFEFSINPEGQPIQQPTISPGDTVHWVWDSGIHTVTSIVGSTEVFDTGNRVPSFTFDRTFNNPGVFTYYCRLHGFDMGNGTAIGMVGTVTVVPTPGTAGLFGLLGASAGLRRRRRLINAV